MCSRFRARGFWLHVCRGSGWFGEAWGLPEELGLRLEKLRLSGRPPLSPLQPHAGDSGLQLFDLILRRELCLQHRELHADLAELSGRCELGTRLSQLEAQLGDGCIRRVEPALQTLGFTAARSCRPSL